MHMFLNFCTRVLEENECIYQYWRPLNATHTNTELTYIEKT